MKTPTFVFNIHLLMNVSYKEAYTFFIISGLAIVFFNNFRCRIRFHRQRKVVTYYLDCIQQLAKYAVQL